MSLRPETRGIELDSMVGLTEVQPSAEDYPSNGDILEFPLKNSPEQCPLFIYQDKIEAFILGNDLLPTQVKLLTTFLLTTPHDNWFSTGQLDCEPDFSLREVKKFVKDLKPTGLLQHNGQRCSASRYQIVGSAVEEYGFFGKDYDPSMFPIGLNQRELEVRTHTLFNRKLNSTPAFIEGPDRDYDIEQECESNSVAAYVVLGTPLAKEECDLMKMQRALWAIPPSRLVTDAEKYRYDIIKDIYTADYNKVIRRLAEVVKAGFEQKPQWMQTAPCNGLGSGELFYPGRGESTKQAEALCHECSQKDECFDYAMANNEVFGIWGGMSQAQYKKLRRQLKIIIKDDLEDADMPQ